MELNIAKFDPAISGKGSTPIADTAHHVLPPLPYAYAALEPHIDARTMTLHHDKHHAAYVEKLNAALEPYAELRRRSAHWLLQNNEAIPEAIRTAVHDNAGGHVNHSLFWQSMSPVGGAGPPGTIAAAMDETFGSLQQFKDRFDEAGAKLFGSGWVWLVATRGKDTAKPILEIVVTSGHHNPIEQGKQPLLLNDVWEHAYYLHYENRRPDYLKSWWSIVNWNRVAERFQHPDEADRQLETRPS
jgi:Fe-Mn family superoxide dismutase